MKRPDVTRSRGEDLLEKVFEATMELTREGPITGLSFQQIAKAAKTSRSVLYRRWPTTFDLLEDIYSFKARKLFGGDFFKKLRPTGEMRADFVQLLTLYQGVYREIGPDIINNYFYIKTQNRQSGDEQHYHPDAVKLHIDAVEKILCAARDRGKKIRKVEKRTMMLPFDLIRMENLVLPGNVKAARIRMMVDDILLPVFG